MNRGVEERKEVSTGSIPLGTSLDFSGRRLCGIDCIGLAPHAGKKLVISNVARIEGPLQCSGPFCEIGLADERWNEVEKGRLGKATESHSSDEI
jgi:hypothetical protein